MKKIKDYLSSLDRRELEELRTKVMIAFFIGLFCWLGGAILMLLLPGSLLISFVSWAGKVVFWVGLIIYLVSGVGCMFIPTSKKKGKKKIKIIDTDDEDINLRG